MLRALTPDHDKSKYYNREKLDVHPFFKAIITRPFLKHEMSSRINASIFPMKFPKSQLSDNFGFVMHLHFFGNVRLLHYIPAKIIRVFVVMGSCTIASLKPTKVSWNKSFLYARWLQRKLYAISCAENELILTLKEINEPQFDFHFANDRNRIFRIRQVLLSTPQ